MRTYQLGCSTNVNGNYGIAAYVTANNMLKLHTQTQTFFVLIVLIFNTSEYFNPSSFVQEIQVAKSYGRCLYGNMLGMLIY